MKQSVHGGDIYSVVGTIKDVVDFSANINPFGVPEGVKAAVAASIVDCCNYPDPFNRELRSAVAEYEGVSENELIFGNGAADLIFKIVAAIKPGRALLVAPTFAEYETALLQGDCSIEYYELSEDRDFRIGAEYIDRIDENTDILFLCNPNNPTGQLIDHSILRGIIDKSCITNTVAVIDECFIDFVEDREKHSLVEHISQAENVFILKAFTKNYGIPGIRLGYGISGNRELMSRMDDIGQPWSVSVPAQAAGISAVRETEYLEAARQLVFRQRKFMAEEMKAIGFRVFEPAANYIFFKLTGEEAYVESFKDELLQEGIIIRGCHNYRGLDNSFYRVAVKGSEDNIRLIEALKRREKKWQRL